MNVKSTRHIDGQGRVVLPAYIRNALSLGVNDTVTIEVAADGNIVIKPTEKRCCVCEEPVTGQPHITITTRKGEKFICSRCSSFIHAEGEWDR